jgi:simple sugar transport system ATP-binding protein
MLTHPTLDQLRALKLDGMAQAFVELETQEEVRNLAHPEWLALLLDREVAYRNTRRFQTRLLLMDEPTAAISVRQVAGVLSLIRELRDRRLAVVLVSHRMPDVFSVADRIVVLRRGRKVADKPIAQLTRGSNRIDHWRNRTGLR